MTRIFQTRGQRYRIVFVPALQKDLYDIKETKGGDIVFFGGPYTLETGTAQLERMIAGSKLDGIHYHEVTAEEVTIR